MDDGAPPPPNRAHRRYHRGRAGRDRVHRFAGVFARGHARARHRHAAGARRSAGSAGPSSRSDRRGGYRRAQSCRLWLMAMAAIADRRPGGSRRPCRSRSGRDRHPVRGHRCEVSPPHLPAALAPKSVARTSSAGPTHCRMATAGWPNALAEVPVALGFALDPVGTEELPGVPFLTRGECCFAAALARSGRGRAARRPARPCRGLGRPGAFGR